MSGVSFINFDLRCCTERRASKEAVSAIKNKWAQTRQLRDGTDNDLFFDLLGKWVPVAPRKELGRKLTGTLEFWADNNMSAELVAIIGVRREQQFKGTAGWMASRTADGKAEIKVIWNSKEDLLNEDSGATGSSFEYSPDEGIIVFSGIGFRHDVTFESHLHDIGRSRDMTELSQGHRGFFNTTQFCTQPSRCLGATHFPRRQIFSDRCFGA
ncbi:hypothetical protein AB1Y20_002757 [Prymnesium parvum]|uniref:Uncharacterized protein n=1 Tax=Prymnesium parvum TaxID=97485 RepID=A0AB34JA09_PRYPA